MSTTDSDYKAMEEPKQDGKVYQAHYKVNTGRSCYDKLTIGNKPRMHWIIWCSGFFAILLLIFALLLDSITLVRFEAPGNSQASGLIYKMSCGWKSYDGKNRGFNNALYTLCDGVQCQQQFTAGKIWIAFGIMACLPIPLFLFGFYKDYYSGIIDGTKPIDYFKWWCCCQSLGFTLTSILYIFLFEILMIFLYIFTNACKKESFWDDASVQLGRVNFRYMGGPSMAFVVMSWLLCISIFIQILYYQYRISAELPTAEAKESKFKFQLHPPGMEPEKKPPPKPKPKPKEATGVAPDSQYFNPKTDVTNDTSSIISNNNNNTKKNINNKPKTNTNKTNKKNKSNKTNKTKKNKNNNKKPAGPPPVPQKARPTGLPPVPAQ